MPLDHRAARHAAQPSLDTVARMAGDRVRPRLHASHIDAHRTVEHHAVLAGPPRQVRRISTGNQRLRRCAAGVDAGAAEQLALDHRHGHARAGQTPGQRRDCLTRADDDRIERVTHARPLAHAPSHDLRRRNISRPARPRRTTRPADRGIARSSFRPEPVVAHAPPGRPPPSPAPPRHRSRPH